MNFSSLSVKPNEIHMCTQFFFSENSVNRQVVDTALFRACVASDYLSL